MRDSGGDEERDKEDERERHADIERKINESDFLKSISGRFEPTTVKSLVGIGQ